MSEPLFWVLFNAFVLVMLALDLGVFHRGSTRVTFREAMAWSLAWIAMAAGFAVLVYLWHGREPAVQFTASYLVELSLSVDNLFVFLMIFRYFHVPNELQHKVLFWGILGAIVMRGVFIVVGVGLIRRFHWITYIFGALLIYSGIKLLGAQNATIEPEKNPVLRLLRRLMPMTETYEKDKFIVRRPGLHATPLLAVLIIVETTDLLFATDSIPAVLAISRDAFIVYTSNVFAILGLRSMYFALSRMIELFDYLHYGLAVVLVFIGLKMLAADRYAIPTEIALGVVIGVLLVSVMASLVKAKLA
ncbi:MAG TPA: TerC family protein [Terriglobales bacterium]